MRIMVAALSAALALSQSAEGSTWCPIPDGPDFSLIPAGTRLEVARNSLTLFEGDKRIECAPQGHDAYGNSSDFTCPVFVLGAPCDPSTELCVVGIEFSPNGETSPG